uniref:Reverse transcriptase Ty1/copia-type domain-containing protein n=1 Tax=Physcomitrium patens TaxID=3218 RepID=A0A2K1IHT9_PHYPA|nr:hypothetical protein PHYPA_027538 [Physcomitrium patens]
MWLQTLFKEIGHEVTLSSKFYFENQLCIAMTQNPYFHDSTKYIDIKYFYI